MKRHSIAIWNGTGTDGHGTLTSKSGALSGTPYSFFTRFQSEDGTAGTNPEELIAAAHAGCFTMALSFKLSGAGYDPEELKAKATIDVEKKSDGFEITGIHVELEGKVAKISKEDFKEYAEQAFAGCPVSKALGALKKTLDVKLV